MNKSVEKYAYKVNSTISKLTLVSHVLMVVLIVLLTNSAQNVKKDQFTINQQIHVFNNAIEVITLKKANVILVKKIV